MKSQTKVRQNKGYSSSLRNAFFNEEGAIDLSSIMVGVIVLGLIGGVIAATVFAVIPWTQDNAAKQQLVSLQSAQDAYYGLSADPASSLPTSAPRNSFYDSAGLESSGLMSQGQNYCTVPTNAGQDFDAYAKSASGKIFKSSRGNKTAVELPSGSVITGSCSFLNPSTSVAPYVDPTPAITTMTYKCDVANSGLTLPWKNLKGKVTWSDGTVQNYAAVTSTSTPKALAAGTTYTVTLDGTFTDFFYSPVAADQQCIRSLDHWGSASGTVTGFRAFQGASNLISVPDHIPSTLTDMREMFVQATSFNDPNVSKWDTSNVTNMSAMFFGASSFNQPLNDWNVSNVTTMTKMFSGASKFNQPLDNWKTGNVTSLTEIFSSASKFNQDLSNWDVSKVKTMDGMFFRAYDFNKPLNSWKTLSVTNLQNAFSEATSFNQTLNNWDTSKVTTMTGTFWAANAFNQNVSGWNVAAVTTHTNFANAAFNSAYLPAFPTP